MEILEEGNRYEIKYETQHPISFDFRHFSDFSPLLSAKDFFLNIRRTNRK